MARVIAAFAAGGQAVAAVSEIRGMGVPRENVSLFYPPPRAEEGDDDDDGDTGEGDEESVLLGVSNTLAGLAGRFGAGVLAVPGTGTYLGIGPLAAGFSGTVSDLAEALQSGGVEGSRVPRYEGLLRKGRIVAVVSTERVQAPEIVRALRRHAATDIDVY